MVNRCLIATTLVVFGTLLLASCGGGGETVDPYAEVSLEQATRGPVVVSKGFKYKLRAPNIVESDGDLLLLKEGNIMEMIVGSSIADKLEGKDLSTVEFNVVKKYTPFVHFRCEQIVAGTDTVFFSRAGTIAYPRVFPADDFKAADFDEYDLDRLKWNRTQDLRKTVDKQFWVTGTVSRVEEEGNEVWMLTGNRGSTVRIVDLTDGVEIVLKLLVDNNMPFEGGITFTEVEPWPERRNNQICGNVEVDYVKYLDKVLGS
jgi:hypothetical protein